jgi:predicted ATPase/class 3 adenylate cyclase
MGSLRSRRPVVSLALRRNVRIVPDQQSDLPEGTVTLLFSDIEGSTALLIQLGDRYAEVLSAQRALIRRAMQDGDGREMGTEGDSFYIAFASATSAVGSCVAAQRSLHSYDWPDGTRVRVRMGLHTGHPTRFDDAYVGIDVHRAARIAAAAHGGQIVLSDATRQSVEADLPSDVALRDLGWHRLKDIEEPEQIFQLVIADVEDQFAALKTLGAPTSLPLTPTPLVGRDLELHQLQSLIRESTTRLVTLTGTGGVGKTRLALAGAAALGTAFRHGVYFVSLATVSDVDGMWGALADALAISCDGPPDGDVQNYLSTRHALVILDNLEHLPGARSVVSVLLESSQELVVLSTSRRPLRLRGEHEVPVAPLDCPEGAGVEAARASGAVQLFAAHAAMVSPGFEISEENAADLSTICRRLDGLPLAIELVASRVKLLTPKALLARLQTSLDVAAGDAERPSRHQTMRATISWSYDLLDSEAQRTFCLIGVFEGGCDVAALGRITSASFPTETTVDPLQQVEVLLDASLISVAGGVDGEPRATMLETIRGFALERLEHAGDLDLVRRAHAEYFADFSERMSQQFKGPAGLKSLEHLEIEHDNARAALRWSLDVGSGAQATNARTEIGLRLVLALSPFWYQHSHATEGRTWLVRAVDLASDEAGAPLAHVAHWFAVLLQQQGENDAALHYFERSLAIWKELGDQSRVSAELNSLGITRRALGQYDIARSLLEEAIAIARETDNALRLSTALTSLGHVETSAGNISKSLEALEEALALDVAHGDEQGATINRQSLALTNLYADRAQEASRLMASTVEYVIASQDMEFLANTIEMFAVVAAALGDPLRAALLCGAAEGVRRDAEMPISRSDLEVVETFIGPARDSVDQHAWEEQIAAGRALTQQQAADLIARP